MSSIKIEKPTEEKLKSLNINSWSSWGCEVSTFDWEYSSDEQAYALEGKVKVKPVAGKEVEINKGDLVTFPQGMQCTWKVLEPIKKVYRFL
ncbi:MAG: cupin domain-containing protein [Candidatus Omnitrophica bacterium]|nr:cupin domain-containing protein [Candidatus Omnitrophota bacterium]